MKYQNRHWEILNLVNETGPIYTFDVYHKLGLPDVATAADLMDKLWDKGLLVCLGHYTGYVYKITDAGKAYLQNNARPLKPFKVK